jgi:hypothetical protein
MAEDEETTKAKLRLDLNRSLLAINFTIFALIVSLNPSLFKLTPFTLQLTTAIPLLLSSSFARTKVAYSKKPEIWKDYGYYTFLIGYSFMINVFGIILSKNFDLVYGIFFLIFNIFVAIMYSLLEIIENKSKLRTRIIKDSLFITIIVLGGILPSLGVY